METEPEGLYSYNSQHLEETSVVPHPEQREAASDGDHSSIGTPCHVRAAAQPVLQPAAEGAELHSRSRLQ